MKILQPRKLAWIGALILSACGAGQAVSPPPSDDGCEICMAQNNCTPGQCPPVCVPDCTSRTCGDDGCGGSCGGCLTGEACDPTGQCIVCTPSCAGNQCGGDGCGGSCGSCSAGEGCAPTRQCVSVSPQITAAISASRVTGVAPLFVFFDATVEAGTDHSDPDVVEFLDLLYVWDFGDPGAGMWANSGHSKNTAIGGIAAHVFDAPGIYDVWLTVRDKTGGEAFASVTVFVDDPEQIFSGTNTVCIRSDASGDFTGCPAGAPQATNPDFSQALRTNCAVHDNNATLRCLFRRGDSFSINAGGQIRLQNGPITIGAFGSGARPVVDATAWPVDYQGSVFDLGRQSIGASDIRITDLDFQGPVGTGGGASQMVFRDNTSDTITDVLIYRCNEEEFGQLAGITNDNYSQVPHQIAVVDNSVNFNHHRSLGFFLATRSAYLGNTCLQQRGDIGSSHMRHHFGRKLLWQHNRLEGAMGNSMIKTAGNAAPAVGGDVPAVNDLRYWILADNIMECNDSVDDGGSACVGGYNQAEVGIIREVVVERNFAHMTNESESFFAVPAQGAAVRNNVVLKLSSGANPHFTSIVSTGGTYTSADWRLQHNTCFRDYSSSLPCIRLDGTGHVVRNNLYYTIGDSSSGEVVGGSGYVASNNLQTDQDLFANSGGIDEASDLRLDPTATGIGAVVEAGFDLASAPLDGAVYLDFARQCRPADEPAVAGVGFDIGAFESSASNCHGL